MREKYKIFICFYCIAIVVASCKISQKPNLENSSSGLSTISMSDPDGVEFSRYNISITRIDGKNTSVLNETINKGESSEHKVKYGKYRFNMTLYKEDDSIVAATSKCSQEQQQRNDITIDQPKYDSLKIVICNGEQEEKEKKKEMATVIIKPILSK